MMGHQHDVYGQRPRSDDLVFNAPRNVCQQQGRPSRRPYQQHTGPRVVVALGCRAGVQEGELHAIELPLQPGTARLPTMRRGAAIASPPDGSLREALQHLPEARRMVRVRVANHHRRHGMPTAGAQERNHHPSARIGLRAIRGTGVEHERMVGGFDDRGAALPDIQHLQMEAALRRPWRRPKQNGGTRDGRDRACPPRQQR